MNSAYFQAVGGGSLHLNLCSVTALLAMSSGKITRRGFYDRGLRTGLLILPQYMAISRHSCATGLPSNIREWLTSLPPVSPVSLSLLLEKAGLNPTPAINGRKREIALASYDRDSRCWRTSQASLLNPISEPFSGSWPKSGTMRDGKIYRRPKWEPNISGAGNGYWLTPDVPRGGRSNPSEMSPTGRMPDGSKRQVGLENQAKMTTKGLWPTPTLCGNHNRKGVSSKAGDGLATAVKFPTPTASCHTGPGKRGEGGINPQTAVKFPTPTNSMMTMGDMEQARFAGNGGKRPSYWEAQTYATPTTQDGAKRASIGAEARRFRDKGKQETLTAQIGIISGAVDMDRNTVGQLSAFWVEWLMHWPLGWSNLTPISRLVWLDPSEDPHPRIPRVASGQKNRTNRLKAIGNGQYPDCVAAMFLVLAGEVEAVAEYNQMEAS